MTETVCTYGLWHLGCVTAACLAAERIPVIGLDGDLERVLALQAGQPPVAEPGLASLINAGLAAGLLRFTSDVAVALATATVLWVTFDTPVDDRDRGDVQWVRAELDAVRPYLRPGTLVLVSSQVPVGFTTALARDWRQHDPSLQVVCCPENLRLGQAIESFRRPARVVLGAPDGVDRARLARLFAPFSTRLEWMSPESAEMSKHALNGFLAVSVVYANELARICERVGADASDVERALRTEPRIGPQAYVAAGSALAGGTLARDVTFLGELAATHSLAAPLIDAVSQSNRLHQQWLYQRILELLVGIECPRVVLLGLTYKPGTDTLRRSAAIELARALAKAGVTVGAFDPAVRTLPSGGSAIQLAQSLDEALEGAHVAVLGTAWPEFRELSGDQLVRTMRQPCLVDQAGFLDHLASDPRITYLRVGRPAVRASRER